MLTRERPCSKCGKMMLDRFRNPSINITEWLCFACYEPILRAYLSNVERRKKRGPTVKEIDIDITPKE